ncbi:MAG: hypothetical protein IT371_08650 [Deltaproteobacteria bacterium]|nr:hypothetical protein [Deltaproteobacteria bacterium]
MRFPARAPRCSLALCVLWVGCTVPNPGFDPDDPPEAGATDAGAPLAEASVLDPVVVPPLDAASGPADLGRADARAPVTPPPPVPPPPPVGSGLAALCTTTCPTGERCVRMEEGAASGVCLRSCSKPNNLCSVPDPKFFSGCATYTNPELGSINVCMVFCRIDGKTYPCPDAVNYKCKAYGSKLSVCAAK